MKWANIECYELGQTTRTVQCHSCWKHLPERLAFCSCGVCLRPDEATIKKDQSKIPSFDSTLLSLLEKIDQGARSMAKLSGNKIIGKHWMPEEAHGITVRTLLKSGGKRMKSTGNLS